MREADLEFEAVKVHLSRDEMYELLGIDDRGPIAIQRIDVAFSPMMDEWTIYKEDGRWPSEAGDCVEHWYAERSMNHLTVDDLLTGLALLEGQPK